MTTPTFWRRASFSVAETAEMIGVSEDGLRAWIARNPTPYTGTKTAGRLWLSGLEGFHYLIIAALTAAGVPVRIAMFTAAQVADSADDGPPPYRYMIIRSHAGVSEFELADTSEITGRPATVLPLRDLYEAHLHRCADYNSRDAV